MMKNGKMLVAVIVFLVLALFGSWGYFYVKANDVKQEAINSVKQEAITEPQVKMSSSSICHEKGSQYYGSTKNFTPYSSLDDCRKAGGRMPY